MVGRNYLWVSKAEVLVDKKNYLCECKFQTRDSKHDLGDRDEQVLRHYPGQMELVGGVGRVQHSGVKPTQTFAHTQHIHATHANQPFARTAHLPISAIYTPLKSAPIAMPLIDKNWINGIRTGKMKFWLMVQFELIITTQGRAL